MTARPYDAETCFPWRLAEEVFTLLKEKRASFARYADLVLPDGSSPITTAQRNREYAAWRGLDLPLPGFGRLLARAFRNGCRALPERPLTVVLQHDADRQPYKTGDMLEHEARAGLVSSAYFFRRRNVWDDDDEPYDLDVPGLQRRQSDGFEVGYHVNSYELADYDLSKARTITAGDVSWFRERFNLRTFVPHGGRKGRNRVNNEDIPHDGALGDLVWAANKRGLLFDFGWSDGEIGFRPLEDPRDFVRRAPEGSRLRMLMHPQYYGNTLSPFWLDKPIAKQRWWREMWGLPDAA